MKKILVAEDGELNRIVIIDMLGFVMSDIKIEIVENGMDAYEKLKESRYDLFN